MIDLQLFERIESLKSIHGDQRNQISSQVSDKEEEEEEEVKK